jgi:hypothetical protein
VLEGRSFGSALQQLRRLSRFARAQVTPPYRSGSALMFSPTAKAPHGAGRSARQGQTWRHCRAAFAAWQRCDGYDGRTPRWAKLRANGATGYRRQPRQPCHTRAIHSSPEGARADNHGQSTNQARPAPFPILAGPNSARTGFASRESLGRRASPWRRSSSTRHGIVALVRAGSARQQEPLVLSGHERSHSANENPRSWVVHRSDLARRRKPTLGSNPT